MRLHRRYLPHIYEITPVIQHNLLRALCKRIRSGNNSLIYSEHNAHIDSLTKLPNRRWLDHAFQREQQNSIKNKRPLCLIMLDVDFFKNYNDQHGHLAGDAVLQFISQQLRDQLRPHDSLARFGGEEFVILLPNLSLPEAAQVAERLRSCLAKFSRIPNSQPTLPGVTISLGVAEFSLKTNSTVLSIKPIKPSIKPNNKDVIECVSTTCSETVSPKSGYALHYC